MREAAIWTAAPVPAVARELAVAGWSPLLSALLARRGVGSPDAARRFLAPSRNDLRDPRELAGLASAVARLKEACLRGERVAVVGDYDADGVTATALLATVLRTCGLEIETILPDRFRDGYGFQPSHAETAAERGCRVLVTVDCGIGSHEAVERSTRLGLEVIITDHHLPGATVPTATAVLDPHSGGPEAPGRELTGVGLALKLGIALLEELGRPVPLESLLRVACLGTIADVAPLLAENRVIAALGLAALRDARSPGLRALLRIAQVEPPVKAEDVAFRLAPRLNAAGRLGSADLALELLCTRDERRATELAQRLDRLNRERQGLELRAVQEARARFEPNGDERGILVDWSPTWHRGVVGIAAGRLARELHRPALLLAEQEGVAVGSGRSVPGIDLHRFLEPWEARMMRFGGHSQAIGLSVAVEALETLRGEWEAEASAWPPEWRQRRLEYEVELGPSDLIPDLVEQMARLAPHGLGNPEPTLRLGPLVATRTARAFGNGHLEIQAGHPSGGGELELVGWGWADRRDLFTGTFEVLVTLRLGQRATRGPGARIVDARPADRRVQESRHVVESPQ